MSFIDIDIDKFATNVHLKFFITHVNKIAFAKFHDHWSVNNKVMTGGGHTPHDLTAQKAHVK